ncbi:unnamed protein product [Heligmosomoides polygyrus]|uniref:Reverse transcriptase domain-containing protein n=1 Tax=Heligmosomoides polygyrus TaxID=6339 RepID=A0A183G5L5_HELPZ|nr:unnamed protein product [Heligmosomoides polygyrus]
MREKEAAVISRVRLPTVTTFDESWKKATDAIRQAVQSELGSAKPGRRKVDKQTWLWTNDLKAKVREKKLLYHVFLGEKTADNWRRYQEAKRAAKFAVAVEKATHYGDVNEKLESRDGERYLYRLARFRHRQSRTLISFSASMMRMAVFLWTLTSRHRFNAFLRKKALKRWRDNFEEISTVEFPHPTSRTHGPFQKITMEEIEVALSKMRPGKATGPDDVAADLWKPKC